jgi:signal peptidase II
VRRVSVPHLALALGVAAVVVAADQFTKTLAVDHLHRPVHVIGPFGLLLGYNTGSAFSLFTGSAPVLAVVAVVLVVLLVAVAGVTRHVGMAVGIGLVLGGALGNLADRVVRHHHGGVVDFITLSHWPTFNVADSCIVIGVAVIVVVQLVAARRAAAAPPGDPQVEP